MDRIEDLVRTSLRERGDDAEPTPHLYRQVQRRIEGRRRRRAWAFVPVAAVIAAAVAVPFVLERGPQVPDIVDSPPGPANDAAHVLVSEPGGALVSIELATGARELLADTRDGVDVVDLHVGVDATFDDFTAIGYDDAVDPAFVTYRREDGGEVDVVRGPAGRDLGISNRAPWVLSDDGRWIASIAAEGIVFIPVGEDGVPRAEVIAAGVSMPEARAPLDWDGPTNAGGTSILTVTGEFGIEHVVLEGMGSAFEPIESTNLPRLREDVTVVQTVGVQPDAADPFVDLITWSLDGVTDSPTVEVADATGRVLAQTTLDESESELSANTGSGWHRMDVRGDTAAVATANGAVATLARQGDGLVVDELEASGGAVALLADAPAVAPEAEEPGDGDRPGPEERDPPVPTETEGWDGRFGDGLVVADRRTVALIAPDGTRTPLHTFPEEGESTIVDVSVRPGSTVDDLTVAITTTAEGMLDLWSLRVVAGEFAQPLPLQTGPFPLAADDLGVPPTAAWSPDGDLLAVVTQVDADAPVELRTLGWTDAGPSDDPNLGATFTLDTDRPWSATDWVWIDATDDGDGVTRSGQLVLLDPREEVSALLALERQGDGAVALAPDASPQVRGPALALDTAGARGPGGMDGELTRTGDTTRLQLWRWTDADDGAASEPIVVDVGDLRGSVEVAVLAGWETATLLVLDPARPAVVDRATGEIVEVDVGQEVVAADALP